MHSNGLNCSSTQKFGQYSLLFRFHY